MSSGDPRDDLWAAAIDLSYRELLRLRLKLGTAPQYDGLDDLRGRLFVGNGQDPDPIQYPWVYDK